MASKNKKYPKNELTSKKLWHYFLMLGLVGCLSAINAKLKRFTPQENFDLNAFFEYANIVDFFKDNYLFAIGLLCLLIAMIFMIIDKRKK